MFSESNVGQSAFLVPGWVKRKAQVAVDAQGRIVVVDRDLPALVTITPGRPPQREFPLGVLAPSQDRISSGL